jgi:hypothetical protein
MRKTLLASMLTAGLVLPALAEDAGTIKLHSGWKLIQERVDKGVAYGTLWGITFNDTGEFLDRRFRDILVDFSPVKAHRSCNA